MRFYLFLSKHKNGFGRRKTAGGHFRILLIPM